MTESSVPQLNWLQLLLSSAGGEGLDWHFSRQDSHVGTSFHEGTQFFAV